MTNILCINVSIKFKFHSDSKSKIKDSRSIKATLRLQITYLRPTD